MLQLFQLNDSRKLMIIQEDTCSGLKTGWWMTHKECSLLINFLICMDHPRSYGPLRRNGGHQLGADARLSLVTCQMSIVSTLVRDPVLDFSIWRHTYASWLWWKGRRYRGSAIWLVTYLIVAIYQGLSTREVTLSDRPLEGRWLRKIFHVAETRSKWK